MFLRLRSLTRYRVILVIGDEPVVQPKCSPFNTIYDPSVKLWSRRPPKRKSKRKVARTSVRQFGCDCDVLGQSANPKI